MRTPTARSLTLVLAVAFVFAAATLARGEDDTAAKPDASRGYEYLLSRPYLPAPFDEKIFSNLWRTWPKAERKSAEALSPAERRALTFERYGLTPRPGGDASGPPLQYVVSDKGTWHTNCFACHGGQIEGKVIPGLPNNRHAMQSLVEDVRDTKKLLGIPFGRSDLASAVIPFGETHGVTNAVVFSIVLLQFRDKDLNVIPPSGRLRFPHHDLDAPPWWHYKKRKWLYIDGFTKRSHRSLMQFLLVPQNTRDKVLAFEPDYRDIEAFIASVEAPKYPFPIDSKLAAQGRLVFQASCAGCHGTYGASESYPEKLIPIDVIGTDRARLDSATVEERTIYGGSWFTDYDPSKVRTDPGGYVAPPLDGIWASAPYLHNGSVPTLRDLLFPEERPTAWKRVYDSYDQEKVGMRYERADAMPEMKRSHASRYWFDTTRHGKSNKGHDFPSKLSKVQRRALLEYLKTL